MTRALMVFGLAALGALTAGDAAAQYYYGPPPGYYRRTARIGTQCRTAVPTPYGLRPLICPIVDPKPVGRPCGCPAPGYGNGYIRGRTIP